MAEGNEISPEQTEQLIQFQDLTGIEDMDKCRQILERHSWNIEMAVQDTFNESEGRPSVFVDQARERRREVEPIVNANPVDQRIFTISRPQPVTSWSQWCMMLIFSPFRFTFSTIFGIFHWIKRLVWPDPRRLVVDPVGDVMSFIVRYEETYGAVHPTFYQGSYSQAINDAKRELKFLLVYLHSDEHQDTPVYCRETLGNTDVCEFINTRMLFWAASVETPEGYRVSLTLRENTYPFLAVIVQRDSRMTVVARIEGPIKAQDLIQRLTRIMNETEGYLVAARHDREERRFTQTLRQQQDQAYEESLKADQEKVRKRKEEDDKKRMEEEHAQRLADEKERKLQERDDLKRQKLENLAREVDEHDPNAVKIVFKMPNGTRLERCFLNSQSLEVVYDYIFVQDDVPNEFQIVTNYPRRVLQCQSTADMPVVQTLVEAGLQRREMLYIQDVSD
ncbi:FAS-associated factor 2-like [Anneissia japonica]|uniref:FAS-associated factor 2-like n=1 Tax=Anneissia japonica TaxID=1529436 RepID=UPI00142556F4|nr:FAS-associated factor 2-like [Anneissia japonica]